MTKIPVTTFPFGLDSLPDNEISNKDPHLYYSNRALIKNFNMGRMIDLFGKIFAFDPRARLIISNDGSLRKELEAKVKGLGLSEKIEFKGFVSLQEQADIYSRAQFYISIPTSDATSVSLLEAMAFVCNNLEWQRCALLF